MLDRATAAHPVFIQAWAPVVPNVCAFNSVALERLRLTRDTPDRVEHVWIMWARDAARALGWEGIGTLAPGSRADLIVVDRDPLVCPQADLPHTRVLCTVLGGRVVWDAGAL